MEFNIGDRVKLKSHKSSYSSEIPIVSTGIFKGRYDVEEIFCAIEWDNPTFRTHDCQNKCDEKKGMWCKEEDLEIIGKNSIKEQTKMEKKIIKVLAVNKKTGLVEKDVTVVAEDEQSAILKAFKCDVENLFIKTTEEGSFKEDKPVEAFIVKEGKKQ